MKKIDNIKFGVDIDKRELERTLELAKKLKYELIEINKQLKIIYKLGITKRQLKQVIKEWFRK